MPSCCCPLFPSLLQLCPTRSIWTIDLAHLLAKCGAAVQMLTVTIGANQARACKPCSACERLPARSLPRACRQLPPCPAAWEGRCTPVIWPGRPRHGAAQPTAWPAVMWRPWLLRAFGCPGLQAYSGEQFYAETMKEDVRRVNALFQVGASPHDHPSF